MAKNQKIDKNRLFESFITQTLENEKMPKSVYLFCSKIGIEESVFYQYYGSLDGLRTALFEAFYINTIELIEKQEDFDKKTSKVDHNKHTSKIDTNRHNSSKSLHKRPKLTANVQK